MMRQQPDTGESAAAIYKRADDANQAAVLEHLRAGKTLVRPPRLRDFYVDHGQGPSGPSLTAARVRKLEREGVLRYVGVDRYGLNTGRAA